MSDNQIYNNHIDEYKQLGFDMMWTMKNGEEVSIKDMQDSHIKNCMGMLHKNLNHRGFNETIQAWLDIFIDVNLKRRKLKLDKIKSKMK